SLIGFDPEQILSARDQVLTVTDRQGQEQQFESDNPYYLLRDIMPQDILSRGYAGGLTGYIGYDCMNYFEPSLKVQSSDYFEAFKFGVYKDGLILDKMTNEVFYFYYDENREALVQSLIDAPYEGDGNLVITPLGDT